MILNYKKSMSTEQPELIDSHSSRTTVYLRRNIIAVEPKEEGDPVQYEYEEAKLTHDEYDLYLRELNLIDIQKQRADIDYIALMTGLDLEG